MLKDILLKIHEGGEFEELKAMFNEAVGDITAPEIGQLEQELINEGALEIKDIAKLSDLHVALFKESLDEKPDFDTILELKSLKVCPEAVNGKKLCYEKNGNRRFYQ